jgi:hypothetical protein
MSTRAAGLGVAFALSIFAHTCVCQAGIFSGSWEDVIAVTDMTAQGREIEPPTRDKPVYYRGSSLGCKLGSIPGDDLPDVKQLNNFVAKVLAKQGYLPARPGVQEPSLLLVLQWGYLQPRTGDLIWFVGYNARDDIAAPIFPGMLGAEVFRRNFRSRNVEAMLDAASGPIYGIIITAFEYKSAKTPNPIIYWQTRIALSAQGKSMAEALPAMALAAGPTIGRETKSSVLYDPNKAREGDVQMGDPEVLEFLKEEG